MFPLKDFDGLESSDGKLLHSEQDQIRELLEMVDFNHSMLHSLLKPKPYLTLGSTEG